MRKNSDDEKSNTAHPKAKVERSRYSWLFWLVPVGALGLCGWFIYRDLIAGGPVITIYFKNADGLEEKNTHVKFRGAQVGEVKSFELTKDQQMVKVDVRLSGFAGTLARQGSIFWIVRPSVRGGSISGLGTIVSGEYIGVQPGNGPSTNSFVGADKEPITEEPGALQITLHSRDLNSLQELSPIFYRGINVGEVLYFQLAEDANEVVVHARIKKEYAPLVRSDTKFWNAGGIDFRLGLFKGVQVSAETPGTILTGGIAFATPPESENQSTNVMNGANFELYEKAEDKWKTWSPAIMLSLPEKAAQTNSPPGMPVKQ